MNEQASSAPQAGDRDVTVERIVAAVIDLIILFVVFAVMSAIFGDSSSSSGDDGASFSLNLSGAPFILYLLIVLGYYFILELKTGQTVGKMLMKLRVVSVSGAPLTAQNIALRTVLRIVDYLPFFYLVGFIAMVASKQKQRIGDMATGTLVVKA